MFVEYCTDDDGNEFAEIYVQEDDLCVNCKLMGSEDDAIICPFIERIRLGDTLFVNDTVEIKVCKAYEVKD